MTDLAFIEHESGPSHNVASLASSTRAALDLDTSAIHERSGAFEIRLATDANDLRLSQELRFRVFYEEGRAIAGAAASRARRDLCSFDDICDHLLVFDWNAPGGGAKPKLVGTYRLLRRDIAERHDGFYSQGEFDLASLLAFHPQNRFLELGRSCVHPDYRSKRVIELLWRGLWLYARHHRIDALIGCASLPGTDLDANRLPLSFLHHYAQAEPMWQAKPWPHLQASFTPLPKDAGELRRGLLALPPLVKAYLRTGARFSKGAVIDRQFCTTDVFTVMPVAEIEHRYLAYYGEPSCVSGAPVA